MTPKEEYKWWMSVYSPPVSKHVEYPFNLHGFDTAFEMYQYLRKTGKSGIKNKKFIELHSKASHELQVVRDWAIENNCSPKMISFIDQIKEKQEYRLSKHSYILDMEVTLAALENNPTCKIFLAQYFFNIKNLQSAYHESSSDAQGKRVGQYATVILSETSGYLRKIETEYRAIDSILCWINDFSDQNNPLKTIIRK